MYSNGLSEIILGNAIKKLELPREELVIMTKVRTSTDLSQHSWPLRVAMQLFSPVLKDYGTYLYELGKSPADFGIINQKGLNRKVRPVRPLRFVPHADCAYGIAAYLRLRAGQPQASPGGPYRPLAMCVRGGCRVGFTSLTMSVLGHRFDYDTPIEETVCIARVHVCVLGS